ncbi:DUF1285 domain-containing protein [Acetobacteraceae bacterium ESL0709]|nr:DUF1285 domain-containing protein [Acetobacteraceae bacterium ESL0697]MDF7678646.1 DUF1285 domain-containing protein [Acetobacteraceae bacterium ESL0709]
MPSDLSGDAETIQTQADGPLLPFQIRRDGVWLYRGTPIRRKAMVCLFASLLQRDGQGRYWLRTQAESGMICVEDVPFLATDLDFKGKCDRTQNLCFRTNIDELVCLGPDHPLLCDWDRPVDEATIPYIHVRDGEGDRPILARVSRALLFELAALAVPGHVEGKPCLGLWSQNCFFPLSRLPAKD